MFGSFDLGSFVNMPFEASPASSPATDPADLNILMSALAGQPMFEAAPPPATDPSVLAAFLLQLSSASPEALAAMSAASPLPEQPLSPASIMTSPSTSPLTVPATSLPLSTPPDTSFFPSPIMESDGSTASPQAHMHEALQKLILSGVTNAAAPADVALLQTILAQTAPGASAAAPSTPSSVSAAMFLPATEEPPTLNVASLRRVLETYAKRQEEAKKQAEFAASGKSRVGRKPKPRPTDPLEILQETITKRAKNTEAARRSRQKKSQKLDYLTSRNAVLEAHMEACRLAQSAYADRIALLEASLAAANSALISNGLVKMVVEVPEFEAPHVEDVAEMEHELDSSVEA